MVNDNPTPSGPLSGLRVLELAGIGPAPFAAMLLGDLGAEVLRVDRPGGTEIDSRGILDRSRRSVILDLRRAEAAAAVLDLAARADVLIEGFRPGVAERLGVGPDVCWDRNPKLVYGRMTGWGQEGPWSQSAGHDINYIAITGALHALGRAGEPPAIPLNLLGDFGGGSMYLAMGILAALWEADRSGKGQVVDAAIVDGAASLMSMPFNMLAGGGWRDERGTNVLDTGSPYYDVYETADGGWMAVGALERKFYSEFVTLLGLDEAASDRSPEALVPLRKHITAAFKTRTRDEWAAVFEGTDACVAPVLSMREAPGHPHNAARKTFVDIDGHPQPAPAPRFSRTRPATPTSGRPPGSETRAALTDWGLTNVETLIESGIATQT
jgi:alpha-methylacyl-CoA racemase